MNKNTLIAALFVMTISVFGEYNPPPGGDYLSQTSSPFALGMSGLSFFEFSPSSTVYQPASAASVQRLTLDLSYTSFYHPDSSEFGHGIFLGTSIPSKSGVFTADALVVNSELDGFHPGFFTRLHGAFSRDVYDDLYVGIGLNGYLGTLDHFDYGITLDLGFMKHLPLFLGLDDFWWGMVVKDIGKWYDPSDTYTAFPTPFTVGINAGFCPYQKKGFSVRLGGDVLLLGGQNIHLKAGSLFSFGDSLKIGLSWQADMQEIANSSIPSRSLLPGLTVSYSIDTNIQKDYFGLQERGWSKSELRPSIGILPLQDGVYATSFGVNMPLGVIDKDPPEIKIDLAPEEQDEDTDISTTSFNVLPKILPGVKSKSKSVIAVQSSPDAEKPVIDKTQAPTAYISPNNDGIKDELVIPFTVNDKRYIRGYVLRILDSNDTLVKEIGNKETRPENASFRDFFSRMFSSKKGIDIPSVLVWNGRMDDGTIAPDGDYFFYITAWDDNGNAGSSSAYRVTVDTTPPEIELAELPGDERIFSPNDDGNKDVIIISQKGSLEDSWEMEFLTSSGIPVYKKTVRNNAPAEYKWPGTDNSGALLPDGVYRYRISSTDRAGNSSSATLDNIIIDTQATPIRVAIDSAYFSPNSDGIKDIINVSIDIPQKSGLVSWTLSVIDKSGNPVRQYQGTGVPPSQISFDGRDNNLRIIPEGEYYASLEAVFVNGNKPLSESPVFTMDITPPDASVSLSSDIFSPDGDNVKDTIAIVQEGSREDSWTGEIINPGGKTVRTYVWRTAPPDEMYWDGMTDIDLLAEDGIYSYRLSSTDRAGNTASFMSEPFRLSTAETDVLLIASAEAFSPNGDGKMDTLSLSPQIKTGEGVDTYTITVMNRDAKPVFTITGKGKPQDSYIWRGVDTDGKPVPDGPYYAQISILAVNGTSAVSRSRNFIVDTQFPQASISAEYLWFSPNGDGKKDGLPFTQKTSTENQWTGEITDAQNNIIRQYHWKGNATDFVWDGKDTAGNTVRDGKYRYTLKSEDEAGNAFTVSVNEIRADNRRTTAFVTAGSQYLSPSGNGLFETIDFSTIVSLEEGVSRWNLDIVDDAGRNVKSFMGENRVPQKITWNGVGDDGKVRSRTLTARFSVEYNKGDMPVAETAPFYLDIDPPDVNVSLSPVPFSPDNDGVDDELKIMISVKDSSPIKDWTLEIVDRQMVPFTAFSGSGSPKPEIIWSGIGKKGELVLAAEDYPYRLTVTDVLGNTTRITGIIPVDVLVIRDGDKLKIQIASINFEPDKAELSQASQEIIEKNESVLSRLSQILKKYRTYSIVIEGHANPTRLSNAREKEREETEELKPLSESRAHTVRRALIERGISSGRISVIGVGGTRTIANPEDREENWKNRRVEFILEK